MKQTAVVICPGRGTYSKTELGYLRRHHTDKSAFIAGIDQYRRQADQPPIAELDAMESYSLNIHTAGENASALIYACALTDFQDIDRGRYEIVAVTGNSLGWYLALACAHALDQKGAIQVVNTMGSMMKDGVVGGQVVYPVVDEQWRHDSQKKALVGRVLEEVNGQPGAKVYLSIDLGGMLVLGANSTGMKSLMQKLPPVQERYPMQLVNHAAFHTPLLQEISERAQHMLSLDLFKRPTLPMVDGRGHIWQPYACDLQELHDYTFGDQIVCPYYFSAAIEVAIKEFTPDKLIILGPGNTLGPPVAQELIKHRWLGLDSKGSFKDLQEVNPFVLSMGMEEQRALVVGSN